MCKSCTRPTSNADVCFLFPDPQYQGFFDIPVDNLYGRHLLRKYIQFNIPNYQQAVVVSPDAGGAKRATAIADALGMPFALIHKERRPTQINDRQNATMMLVGDVAERTAILVDDLADTSNTITRAAKLLKKEGATQVIALITHGILSGDAIDRINASALDKVIVTNTVPQADHKARCPKLEVLEVGNVFAEVSFFWQKTNCIGRDLTNLHDRLFDVCTMARVSVYCLITASGSLPTAHRFTTLVPRPLLDHLHYYHYHYHHPRHHPQPQPTQRYQESSRNWLAGSFFCFFFHPAFMGGEVFKKKLGILYYITLHYIAR